MNLNAIISLNQILYIVFSVAEGEGYTLPPFLRGGGRGTDFFLTPPYLEVGETDPTPPT